MAEAWASTKFPQFEKQIRNLVKQHLELKDEPLHLAICYAPKRDEEDIFLFEVISGPAGGNVSSDRELFEVTYTATPGFPMDFDQRLHLILTNPSEVDVALSEGWPSLIELLDAIQSNDYQELHADSDGRAILRRFCSEAEHMKGVACG